ncbi:polysaccharide deacetylase family protein [Rhodobaculum claviforme]|uniref:Polysaccharide deacetylase n=1 Tax=Rhodobaculum claviforme TaxID=1549854 RepID=A0A934TL74_9RHOB|nr:polysaccharide deacetylase family protein [Rhodobaculum claviforme]MBK5927892.1 polysaccharide deacetylase [Rhodobaculum claviforme]
MSLPGHGRYDYVPITERADYSWPGGARLAVYIGLNLEHFAFGEGLGAELAPGGPQPDILNYAWRDYGNRVGAFRMLEMFDALRLPASVLANSAMYDYAPQLMAAWRARGDEVVGHGRTNAERQSTLSEADERTLIADATAAITAAEGTPPQGWLSPWIAESRVTPDLLHEAGYTYTLNWCMDDQPVWMRTRSGRILSIPYPQEANDIPAIVARKDGAAQFADTLIDTFDEMLEQSRAQPLVMGIALHPYLVGQPHRLRQLRRALTHIAAPRPEVWITRAGEISRYCHDQPEGLIP